MTKEKESCKCDIRDKCISISCQCIEKCIEYQAFDTQDCFYFTVSPSPMQHISIRALIRDWLKKLFKLSKQLDRFIIVFELAGQRPHIHGVAKPLPGRTLGLLNTVYSWSRYHNAKIHREFTKGIHYLFKEWKTTLELLNIPPLDKSNIELQYNNNSPSINEMMEELFDRYDEQHKIED